MNNKQNIELDILKKHLDLYGIRNTITLTEAPKESPSKLVSNQTSGYEPYINNIISK